MQVYISGIPQGVSGTSASTPTVAGVIGLVNDKRLAAGQAPPPHPLSYYQSLKFPFAPGHH